MTCPKGKTDGAEQAEPLPMPKGNEMKKLSNEELIKILQNTAVRIGMGGYVQELINKADKLEAELLRRLEAGDRAIQACREITKMEIPE